ncbi:hypothetical protein [Nibribacter koreensis]|uniref:hypothetical protein n=1 Tax=Nibribacter koreensis TaxID=1084519 RepID=UPI0031EAD2E1
MNVVTFSNPVLLLSVFPVVLLVFSLGILGWIWAISTNLHVKLPAGVKLNSRRFKLLFLVPVVYILLISVALGLVMTQGVSVVTSVNGAVVASIIIPLHMLSIFLIFWGARFAAKTFRSIELGRTARFSDYIGDFVLIWFSMIGIWILQPRLNNLIAEE